MTFWLLLLLLPSSTDSPRNQKKQVILPHWIQQSKEQLQGDTGARWSSSGSHPALPQTSHVSTSKSINFMRFKVCTIFSSFPYVMTVLVVWARTPISSLQWLYCKCDQHQTQGTGEKIPAEEPRDLEKNTCISPPGFAQQGSHFNTFTFLRDTKKHPESGD